MKNYMLNSYIVFVIILPIISPAQEWVARYNGPGDGDDEANAIVVDNAGNIYVTGTSQGSGTDDDYATVKYDALGMEQWVARYNGPTNNDDAAVAMAFDNAGCVYVTGDSWGGEGTYEDYATVKYDSLGLEQWVARYNGPDSSADLASAIVVDNAGNIYVTGWSWGSGTSEDYATVKYDALGVEQWVAKYDGPANGGDYANAIAFDNAGNIYVTGASGGSGTWLDYATVKYDSLGVEQWVTRYNGPDNGWDGATAIALDNAGNIYVTGESVGSGDYYDYATVKYDALGVEQWVARYNGPGSGEDDANVIAVDNAGNIYVTGHSYGSGTDYDYATVKYDSLGVEQWVARYHGPGNGWDMANAIALDDAGNVYVTGESYGSGTDYDYATIKYLPTGIEEQIIISVKNSYHGATIFSGPLQLPEGKKYRVFDITGRVVEPDKMKPGIYFLKIDNKIVQKVIKIR